MDSTGSPNQNKFLRSATKMVKIEIEGDTNLCGKSFLLSMIRVPRIDQCPSP